MCDIFKRRGESRGDRGGLGEVFLLRDIWFGSRSYFFKFYCEKVGYVFIVGIGLGYWEKCDRYNGIL